MTNPPAIPVMRSLHRTRRRLLALPAALAVAPLAGCATGEPRQPLILGTSTPGGGFARYGEVLARVLAARAGYPILRARPTHGTTENLALLQDGALDAALVQGTAANALFENGSASGLRILYAMYPSPGLLAVPSASPVTRLEDLRGQRVVFGVRASGLVTLGRQVFGGIGIDIDRDLQAIYVDEAAASPRIVLAGGAAGLWGAGEGWPGFETLARSPGGARFIGPTAAQIPRIVARYPSLAPMEVAAGAYPGIDRPLPTVGSINWILARADLDERRAAAFVAAMEAAHEELAAALPQAAFGTLARTRATAPSPALLHRALRAED